MSEDLTNDQIALLCNIGEDDQAHLAKGKERDLERLISEGYAERMKSPLGAAFRLTAKGLEFLGERGVGLNEG